MLYCILDLEIKLKESEWYKKLSQDERKRLPHILYELIPRKCSVNIPGTDDNIKHETDLVFDSTGDVTVQIYSIFDGKTVNISFIDT